MRFPSHIALALCGGLLTAAETFTEDLLVKPLQDGRVLLHFEFSVQRAAPTANDTLHHYQLFPRQIGEISRRYDVNELYLSFTQGGWREGKWGSPPVNSQGIGAEVRARIKEGDPAKSESQWRGLTNALSGVFCASLNFIDTTNTATPRLTFADADSPASGVLRHGYLPRENVCTENLTPWVKQLPCQSKSGLGLLLNPYRLYNTDFHSMELSLSSMKDGKGTPVQQYKQRLSVVVDPGTLGLGDRWSLADLVDRQLGTACPVAARSTVRVIQPGFGLKLTPKPSKTSKLAGRSVSVFDLHKQPSVDIVFEFAPQEGNDAWPSERPTISAHRYVTGHGGSSGGVESTLTNRGDKPVNVTYLDVLPWYLRVYSHTLEIQTQAADGSWALLRPTSVAFTPAIDRERPSSLELALVLPPSSRTTLRYSFDKGFLKYTEHPPDANRGFNIGPAIVSYQHDALSGELPLHCAIEQALAGPSECIVRTYTELFLASLPTPDFSMPYNVITFTCTILALFFGRIFNLLTRDFAVLKPFEA
ncbi:Subunit of the glycosylphosphatidylinositol transamidase complex-like protein [Coemansia sp. RSA 2671]|nr:Subunit of the glycosylphosphatidylinositol transamidase complex-like protein [Coemansia sp. RSA 2675]KAJ2349020.1 Subunit of the glycosylphosphatidylinositol transamidase complex-like protein [Coemansia sp. RSA 2671]